MSNSFPTVHIETITHFILHSYLSLL